MVDIVDEDMGVCVRFERRTMRVITLKDPEEVGSSDICPSVVNLIWIVDVYSWCTFLCRRIEDLARVRVEVRVGHIIVGKVDDLLARNAIRKHDFHCMMRVSLMAIVAIPT